MKKKNTHLAYGLVSGLAIIIVQTALYVAGYAFKPGMQYVSFIPFLVGIIANAFAFTKANDHNVTFGNVFGSGFRTTAIITLITIVWSFASLLIFPEMLDKALEIARDAMAKNPKMTDEQIETGIEFTRKNFKLLMVAGVLFQYVFWGVIFSLIGAAVVKKTPVKSQGENVA